MAPAKKKAGVKKAPAKKPKKATKPKAKAKPGKVTQAEVNAGELRALLSKDDDVYTGDELTKGVPYWTSTGDPILDDLLGGKGIPASRAMEIYGPESCGKTTLSYTIMAGCHAAGGWVILVDAENSWDPERAAARGVNTERMHLIKSTAMEYVFEKTEELVGLIRATGFKGPIMVIVDTYALIAPESERPEDEQPSADEKKKEKGQGMGFKYIMLRQYMRRATRQMYRTDHTFIFLNHITMKLGVVFGDPRTTPGAAIKYWASIRLECAKKGDFQLSLTGKGDKVTAQGIMTQVKVTKSKLFRPYRVCQLVLRFDGTPALEHELVLHAFANKIPDVVTGELLVEAAQGFVTLRLPKGQRKNIRFSDVPEAVKHYDLVPYYLECCKAFGA